MAFDESVLAGLVFFAVGGFLGTSFIVEAMGSMVGSTLGFLGLLLLIA